MSFLAIIVALVLVQIWGSGSRVQHDKWFRGWQQRVGSWGVGPPVKLALVILLPAVLVQIILNIVQPALFGLLWIAMAAALLLYSFGRRDFHNLLEHYRQQCRSGDFEGAYLGTLSELGWITVRDDPVSPQEVHAMVQRGFLYEGYQRWFAVLFYFLLLGPAGALAYRLLQMCQHDFETEFAKRCIFVIDWVPARLVAAAFALTGNFVGSRDELLGGLLDTSVDASELLYTVGTAALGSVSEDSLDELAFGRAAAEENQEIGSLLSRSAVAWVGVIAIAVVLL
ncbi:MAG: regulatory signaling modulator protein AmpE [Halioglobus sp.]